MKHEQPTIPLVCSLRWLIEQGVIGSRRTMFRLVSSGEFPAPDSRVGRKLAWKRATIQGHLERARLA